MSPQEILAQARARATALKQEIITPQELEAFFRTPDGEALYRQYRQAVSDGIADSPHSVIVPAESPVEKRLSTIKEEIEERTESVMKSTGLSKLEAQARVFAKDPALYEQYSRAVMGI